MVVLLGVAMRHAHSNAFGKCDHEVKVCIDEETLDAITAFAYQSGVSKSEYIRQLLQGHAHGYAKLFQMQVVAGMPRKGYE